MCFLCQNINTSGTSIAFLDITRSIPYPGSMGTPVLASLVSSVGEKNCLWGLWPGSPYLLRPQDPPDSRPPLRRHADFPECGDPPGVLPKVPESEAGEVGLVGRFPLLHEAIRLLCGPSLPGCEYSGCGQGVAPGLEDGQGSGEAVHAGAVAKSGGPGAQSDWNR